MKCARCFHPKENHKQIEGTNDCHICTGSIECRCEHFEIPFLVEFAQKIEMVKSVRKTIRSRCEYILEMIPKTRNAGEKTFAKIYKEIWYGFKIRKDGTKLTTEEWKRMPHDDSINREKRRCKQHNENLQTYSKEVLIEQSAIYQALMELAIE